jgi:hypothetical protein
MEPENVPFYGMWHFTVCLVIACNLEEPAASIFKVEYYMKPVGRRLYGFKERDE